MYQGNQPIVGRFSKLDDISSQFNSVLTSFTMNVGSSPVFPGTPQNLIISLDGVLQEPGSAYTISNATITFTEAVPTGTQFFGVMLGNVLNIGIPSDGSVGALQLTNSSVTSAKLASLDHVDMNTSTASSDAVSRVKWNDTDGTLDIGLKGGNVTLQVGQEQLVRVYNNTGQTINNGAVVYITGSSGARPTIALADADSESTQANTIGVVTETIPNNTEGFVATAGLVRGIDTSSFVAGNSLYLSQTAGLLTTIKPIAPAHAVYMGVVIQQHASTGQIFVNPQNGHELDELHDVLISGKTNYDVLQYESATGLWKNVQKGLGNDTTMNGWLTKDIGSIKLDKGSVASGTVTFNYMDGSCQRLQVAGSLTIATSNWPPSGNLGVIHLELVNGGSATVTWPTINWIQKDGTFTTNISTYLTNISRNALQTSGTDFFVFWSSNAGSTVYGKIL